MPTAPLITLVQTSVQMCAIGLIFCRLRLATQVEWSVHLPAGFAREQSCSDSRGVHLSPFGVYGLLQWPRIFLCRQEKGATTFATILIVVLILALLGVLPRWSHSSNWGYYPTGGVGLILFVAVILLLLGRI